MHGNYCTCFWVNNGLNYVQQKNFNYFIDLLTDVRILFTANPIQFVFESTFMKHIFGTSPILFLVHILVLLLIYSLLKRKNNLYEEYVYMNIILVKQKIIAIRSLLIMHFCLLISGGIYLNIIYSAIRAMYGASFVITSVLLWTLLKFYRTSLKRWIILIPLTLIIFTFSLHQVLILSTKNANAKGVRINGSPSILRWSGRASHLEATKSHQTQGQCRINIVLDPEQAIQNHWAAIVHVDIVCVDGRIFARVRIPPVNPVFTQICGTFRFWPGLAFGNL